ncbi:hypothetical protein Tco_1189188, partial [Tanacetum coccineum]
MGPAPSTVKKKPEKSNKQMGSTPLRRSERGKNPVDVYASNVKSTKKSRDISKEVAEEGSRDSNGGSKKRKRYDAIEFKARKSPSFQKQMGPTTWSESGKNPVDVPASNVKSIEKSVVTEKGSRDSNGGSKKRKRYDAGEFKSRKSPRFQKQMGPTTRSAVKKKPEKSEKIGSTPLRRSERGKNPVDVHASNVKSTEKSGDISKEIAEEGSRDSNGGSKKRKRYDAVEFKARKSPSFQKQMGPTTRSAVKKKPEKSEKIGSTPLRRSESGKNPVDVPASNIKSIEKSGDISKEIAEEGSRDSNGGSKKRKRYDAGEFKSRKSPRFQKQMGPTTRSAVKKKPEKSEKIGSTPLRRSERGKNPVDVPALNVKSTEKSGDISKEIAEEGSRDSNGGSKK